MPFPKLVFNDSFDFGGMPLSFLADDRQGLKKSAADIGSSPVVEEWGKIDPIKGHSLVHMIALGEFEKTGKNRNGDAFGRAICESSHPTFITKGALYKDHVAGPGAPRYGHVVKTAYNADMGRVELLVAADNKKCADFLGDIEKGKQRSVSMGFACFDGSAEVTTENGLKPIRAVTAGERVLTHTGQFRKVVRVIENPRGGRKMIRLVGQGVGASFLATEDHQVWAIRKTKLRSDHGRRIRPGFKRDFSPEWIAAGSIEVSDSLVTPVQKLTGQIKMDSGVAYLLGQYLGDGHVSDYTGNSVTITTHQEDTHLLAYMVDICLRRRWQFSVDYLSEESRKMARKPKATSLRIRCPAFVKLCQDYCGTLKDKYPRPEIWNWDQEAVKHFLGGFVDADGSYEPKKGTVSTSSVLVRLNEELRRLLLSADIYASTHKDWFSPNKSVDDPNAGGFANRSPFACILYLAKENTSRLLDYSLKVKKWKGRIQANRCHFFDLEGCRYVTARVRETSVSEVAPETVYCLEVEDDHTFAVLGFVVHNCDYDVCSICGNRAKNRTEYCNCVKKGALEPFGMGRILPDGRACYVDNPAGHWNDISMVPVGADRIAMSLRKVAGLDGVTREEAIGGAELAETLGMGGHDLPNARKLAIAAKLSAMEKRVEAAGIRTVGSRRRESRPISKQARDQMRALPPGEMFALLVKHAAVLPAADFFALVLDDADFGRGVRTADLFTRLEADPAKLASACACSLYDPAPAVHRLGAIKRAVLQEYARHFSLHAGQAAARVTEGVLKVATWRESEPPAETRGERALAKHYAAYKLAALAAMPEVTDAQLLAAVLEN